MHRERPWLVWLAALWWAGASATIGAAPPFPPRNVCTPDPGHVTCLSDHAGLIHGATVHTPTFDVTCKAFRQVWMKRYQGKSSRAETREVVVAGVCEQTTPAGALIRRWSTLEPLTTLHVDRGPWKSVAEAPPPPVVRRLAANGGDRKFWIWSGYYFPQGWNSLTFTDPGVPADFNPWPPLGAIQAWSAADARTLVDSPRFDSPVSCSEGFVVCSAYLKILHPDPASPEVSVEMISARRLFNYRTGKKEQRENDATFLRQVFRAP